MKGTLPENNQHVPECAMLGNSFYKAFFLGKERILITAEPFVSQTEGESHWFERPGVVAPGSS